MSVCTRHEKKVRRKIRRKIINIKKYKVKRAAGHKENEYKIKDKQRREEVNKENNRN